MRSMQAIPTFGRDLAEAEVRSHAAAVDNNVNIPSSSHVA